jgi:putative FmdB family regulatory protein
VPTYQYSCTECDEQLEVVQKFTDDALTVCPVCQGKLRKLFSSVGIVFKGSGFYRTDSRPTDGEAAAPAGDAAKSEQPAAASTSPDGGSGSSSTPAPTPAAPPAAASATPATTAKPKPVTPASGSGTPKAAAS